jgi:hypothetical protein
MQIVVGSRGWPSRPGWEMFPPMCPFSLVGYRPLAEPQDEAHRPCYQEGRGEIEGVPPQSPQVSLREPWQPSDCISWQRWYNKSATDPSSGEHGLLAKSVFRRKSRMSLGSRRDRDGKPNSLTSGMSVLSCLWGCAQRHFCLDCVKRVANPPARI